MGYDDAFSGALASRFVTHCSIGAPIVVNFTMVSGWCEVLVKSVVDAVSLVGLKSDGVNTGCTGFQESNAGASISWCQHRV